MMNVCNPPASGFGKNEVAALNSRASVSRGWRQPFSLKMLTSTYQHDIGSWPVQVTLDVELYKIAIFDAEGRPLSQYGLYTQSGALYGEFRLVPEPSTLSLLAIGIVGLIGYGRKKGKAGSASDKKVTEVASDEWSKPK